jgi:hypothetical protein
MYLRGTIHTSKTDLTDQEYSYNTNYFPSNYIIIKIIKQNKIHYTCVKLVHVAYFKKIIEIAKQQNFHIKLKCLKILSK